MSEPVDILITTIARPGLEAAMLSALAQTYEATRVVVVADGAPEARAIFDRVMSVPRPHPAIYLETPAPTGYGECAKQWWFDRTEDPQPAEWTKTLDDDDWMPPAAVAVMMEAAGPDVSIILGELVVLLRCQSKGAQVTRSRHGQPLLIRGKTGNGNALVRSKWCRGLTPRVDLPAADFERLAFIAAKGRVAMVQAPIYFYNAYRTEGHRRALIRERAKGET